MKLVKYFLSKKPVTILLLVLVLAGGLLAYVKMGKLEDAPFTIKQALVLTPYPGASPSEVQSQVTDVLEESIQALGELYYLKTRADEMQQLWDKLRRKVSDVQSKLPEGAGPSVVNDDFGDVLGVFYGLTGSGHSYRELEDEAKLIKNEILKVKDVAKVEIYGTQTPTIDISVSPSVMARSGITVPTACVSSPPEISIRWTTYATLQSYRAPESISGSRTLPGLKKATRPRQAT